VLAERSVVESYIYADKEVSTCCRSMEGEESGDREAARAVD